MKTLSNEFSVHFSVFISEVSWSTVHQRRYLDGMVVSDDLKILRGVRSLFMFRTKGGEPMQWLMSGMLLQGC